MNIIHEGCGLRPFLRPRLRTLFCQSYLAYGVTLANENDDIGIRKQNTLSWFDCLWGPQGAWTRLLAKSKPMCKTDPNACASTFDDRKLVFPGTRCLAGMHFRFVIPHLWADAPCALSAITCQLLQFDREFLYPRTKFFG